MPDWSGGGWAEVEIAQVVFYLDPMGNSNVGLVELDYVLFL